MNVGRRKTYTQHNYCIQYKYILNLQKYIKQYPNYITGVSSAAELPSASQRNLTMQREKIANKFNTSYLNPNKLNAEVKKKEQLFKKERAMSNGVAHIEDLFYRKFVKEELHEASKKQPGADKMIPKFIKNLGPKALSILYNKLGLKI